MRDNINDLKLQKDRNLHEVKKTFTSISGVENALLSFKLVGSFFDQMSH